MNNLYNIQTTISDTNQNLLQNNLLAAKFTYMSTPPTNTNKVIAERPYFYHSNHLGSSAWITNNAGTPVQSITYLPYGKEFINQQSTSYDAVYKFIGKELDAETGYICTDFRYYDPGLGLFLSVDKLAGKFPFQSSYVYSYNNPINFSDPTGLEGDVTDIIKKDEGKGTNNANKLTTSLSKITGFNVSTETRGNGKSYLSYEKNADGTPKINTDENGNNIGSEKARNELKNLIDNPENIYIRQRNNGGSAGLENLIYLNFGQIQGFIDGANNLNPETLGYGMSLLHEFKHTTIGGGLLDEGKGATSVSEMNIIRSQLGSDYGQRMQYKSKVINDMNGGTFLPFDSSSKSWLNKGMMPASGNKYIKH